MAATPADASSASQPWRTTLRAVGLLLIVVTVLGWAAAGAHRGWTMTQVPTTRVDEVTEIEYTVYEERFVPGLDLLVAGVLIGGAVAGFSFFSRPRSSLSSPT